MDELNDNNKKDQEIENEINVLNHTTDNSEFEKNADLSMVLGILSLVFGGIPILNLVLAIIAIIKANSIPKEHRNGKAIAGMVLGIISIILSVIFVIFLIIFFLALGVLVFNNASKVVDYNLNNNIISGYYENYDLEENDTILEEQNILENEEDVLDENEIEEEMNEEMNEGFTEEELEDFEELDE